MAARRASTGDGGVRGLLGAWRRAAGLTQAQLAAMAGLSVGMVRDLEQGRTRHPQSESLARLAQALGLDAAQAQQLLHAAQPRLQPLPAQGVAGGGGLWVQVLGPVAVWRGGLAVMPGSRMQRAVLGLLALAANHVVHREAIIDALWGADPPASAVNMVQGYASRLRRTLDTDPAPDPDADPGADSALGLALQLDPLAGLRLVAAGAAGVRGDRRLVAVGGGYQLRVDEDELDLLMFERLVAQAHRDAEADAADAAAACALYERALELWQDEPLADVELLRGHPAVVELTRRRQAVVVEYAGLAVEAGLGGQVLAHLRWLTGREPLHEQAHALLMLALAAAGQQAAALEVFQQLRHRLDEQLGVGPGRELSQAHLRVLRQQVPALLPSRHAARQTAAAQLAAAPAPAPPPSGPALAAPTQVPATLSGLVAVVPRQLPAAVRHFTGRASELEALSELQDQAGRHGQPPSGAVVIIAIGGTAGVGKTALAIHCQ